MINNEQKMEYRNNSYHKITMEEVNKYITPEFARIVDRNAIKYKKLLEMLANA